METTTSPRAHLERGLRLEQAGTSDRALKTYQEALAASLDAHEQVEARIRIARVLRTMGRPEEALLESRRAAHDAERIGAGDLAAEALNIELWIQHLRGARAETQAVGRSALAHAKDPRARGITLQNLATIAADLGDFVTADGLYAQSGEAFRACGYELGIAIGLSNRAALARDRGDLPRALELARDSAELARRLQALDVLLGAIQNQAHVLVELRQYDQAEELLTEALGYFTSATNPVGQAECLEIIGELTEKRGGTREAARRCYQRAREIADSAGAHLVSERLGKRLVPRGPEATPLNG